MRRMAMFVAVVCSALWMAAPAHAGGWAMSTLDQVPAPVAGQPVDVGFTILQHGVTPVHLDGDVGITVTPAGGSPRYFPARAHGATGHYVAAVTLDVAGPATWSIKQGGFMAHDLGEIMVAPASAAAGASEATATPLAAPAPAETPSPETASAPRWPSAVRYSLVAGAALLGVLSLIDASRTRRRPVPARP